MQELSIKPLSKKEAEVVIGRLGIEELPDFLGVVRVNGEYCIVSKNAGVLDISDLNVVQIGLKTGNIEFSYRHFCVFSVDKNSW